MEQTNKHDSHVQLL